MGTSLYFLNCHKGIEGSKIKVMIESDGVIQMLEKRVETISDDGWKKFRKQHENEERMEPQLELEVAQKQVEDANKRANESD